MSSRLHLKYWCKHELWRPLLLNELAGQLFHMLSFVKLLEESKRPGRGLWCSSASLLAGNLLGQHDYMVEALSFDRFSDAASKDFV